MGTRIKLCFDKTVVEAELNDTETARAFAAHPPTTISVSGCRIDFCSRMSFDLPYEETQVGRGWTNGDVNYNPDGGWLAVLFDDEENSGRYGDQVNMGRLTGSLDVLHSLSGSHTLVVERA